MIPQCLFHSDNVYILSTPQVTLPTPLWPLPLSSCCHQGALKLIQSCLLATSVPPAPSHPSRGPNSQGFLWPRNTFHVSYHSGLSLPKQCPFILPLLALPSCPPTSIVPLTNILPTFYICEDSPNSLLLLNPIL